MQLFQKFVSIKTCRTARGPRLAGIRQCNPCRSPFFRAVSLQGLFAPPTNWPWLGISTAA
jgi:hypothetical protein